MSGLAGVLHLDGGPADAAEAGALLRHLVHRGPDGLTAAARGCVSMGFARLDTTPGTASESQPATIGELLVAFDGRLDDRETLALQVSTDPAAGDVALVAAAYRRWGSDCAGHLLGDFACTLWDARENILVVARDVMGVRPFCYRLSGRRFEWASEPQALVRERAAAVNERYLADYLCDRVTSEVETPYEGILRLPAAHALTIDASGRMRTWRYWQPDAGREIRYRDPADYVAHFRSLLGSAVRDRLRLAGPATMTLSGGIDSSVVAAEIARQRDEGSDAAAAVAAVTLTYPGRPENEESRAHETAERLRMPWSQVPAAFPETGHFSRDASLRLDLPEPPHSATASVMRRAIGASGRRVVFTGLGGDEWFTGSDGELAGLLLSGRLWRAARFLAEDRHRAGAPTIRRALQFAAWSATPALAKSVVRGVLQRPRLPEWVDPGFAARTGLIDRLSHPEPVVRLATRGATVLFQDAMWGEVAWRRELGEALFARLGLEDRHPLFDRRLIEFACAVPDEARRSHGVSKWPLRHAYRDQLPAWAAAPPEILGFHWVVRDCLERTGGADALRNSAPVTHGWMRGDVISRYYRQLEAGDDRHALTLWQTRAADFWMSPGAREPLNPAGLTVTITPTVEPK